MKKIQTKIIIIDDELQQHSPIPVVLSKEYEKENVLLFSNSLEGVEYIKSNLPQKMIVLLDLDFTHTPKESQGFEIFKQIRAMTSLVHVIFYTGRPDLLFEQMREDTQNILDLINNNAFGLLQKNVSIETVVEMVKKANAQLDTHIECVIEQWILNQDEKTISKPFYNHVSTRQIFSMKEIAAEIRKQTTIGMELAKKILYLAVDLFANLKK